MGTVVQDSGFPQKSQVPGCVPGVTGATSVTTLGTAPENEVSSGSREIEASKYHNVDHDA